VLELLQLVPNPLIYNMHRMVLAAVMVVVAVAVVVYCTVLYYNFKWKHWARVGPKLSKSPRDPDYCGPHYWGTTVCCSAVWEGSVTHGFL